MSVMGPGSQFWNSAHGIFLRFSPNSLFLFEMRRGSDTYLSCCVQNIDFWLRGSKRHKSPPLR